MVPDHEFDVGKAGFFEGGPEEVLDEVALFIGGEDAGFPDLDGECLILNSQAPHGNALGGVGLDVFDVVVGPGLVVFGLELAAVEHFAVGFHPAGRTPRRGVKLKLALGNGLGTFDERDAVLEVVVNGEILEFLVAGGVIVGIHLVRIIAAVNRGAAKGVTVACHGIEAGFEELLLGILGKFGEDIGSGIGEGTAKA